MRTFTCSRRREQGFSLIEVLVASLILTVGVLALAQLFAVSTTSNLAAKSTTYAAVLADQKMEELRSLTWGFDSVGLPLNDRTTDTASPDDAAIGGTGLSPSPETALRENTPGYVDYVDMFGNKVAGGDTPPASATYMRRWSIEPLPTNPNNTLIIQVLVSRIRDRGDANEGTVRRLQNEARVITAKTRKAQ